MLERIFSRAKTVNEQTLKLARPRQMYELNGMTKLQLHDDAVRSDMLKLLTDLRDEPLKPGYSWEQKYKHTSDLRPEAYTYDDLILELLVVNNVHRQLKEITGKELWLSHVQVRRVGPSRGSYMDWHRDTHFYGGNLVGNLPPVHKIIFYPALGEASQAVLNASPGSHRRFFPNQAQDQSQVAAYPVATVMSSDNEALLFDTSLLHSVIPHQEKRDALRVMYSFCEQWQLETNGNPELHRLYRQRAVN